MSNQSLILSGTARSTVVTSVKVQVDKERVNQAAEVATTVIMQKFGEALGASRAEVFEVNAVGLTAALMEAADENADIPKGVFIPAYFDSMNCGLRTKISRTVVSTEILEAKISLPGAYRETVMKMKAAGITFVRPHRPSSEESSTLSYGKENIDGVVCIVGNSNDAAIADAVRRGLYTVEEKSLEVLKCLTGELALMYGELDTLLEEYFISETRVALSI